ncbi:MAG TPA: hypothetical protein VF057_00260 [Thermoanaerobaculia bacterium]
MRLKSLAVAVLLAFPALAQNQFFYPKPDEGRVIARKDIHYREGLRYDVYRPAGDAVVPVVVFANVGSLAYTTWPIYIGWSEAAANAGMAAVVYQATAANAIADFDALIADLRTRSSELKVDPSRIVLWSASANVSVGLPLAMDRARDYIRGAVLYYGDATVNEIRADLPVLFVRAGLDSSWLNERIDKLLARAFAANAPWTVENNGGGFHGFESLNDNEVTRLLIHRTLSFMKLVTRPEVNRAYAAAARDAELGALYARGEWEKAAAGYRSRVAAAPNDGENRLRLGISLLRTKNFAEALPAIEKAWELGRRGTRDVAVPALEAAAGIGNVERATHWLEVVLSSPFSPALEELRTSPAFEPVRNAPQFAGLLDAAADQARLTAEAETGDARRAIEELRRAPASARISRETVLLNIAYRALGKGRRTEAVEIFTLATERYSSSSNAWDSLSEALEAAGRKADALNAARRALSLVDADPALQTAAARDNVRRASSERVARLTARAER